MAVYHQSTAQFDITINPEAMAHSRPAATAVTATYSYLIQVPQVQTSSTIHSGEQGRMDR